MTKCVITGCKNKGLRPCSFMRSGYHSMDLFCNECHPMIEIMCLAMDSRAIYNSGFNTIKGYRESVVDLKINDMIEDAQKDNWNINLIFMPKW
jgi:hypothetical protein